jgi:hypothetical protein
LEVGFCDGGDGNSEGLPAFVRSCRSLTALNLFRMEESNWNRAPDAEWDLASLLIDPTVTTPTSQGLILPQLQHLSYEEADERTEDRLAVLQCIRSYGPQLLTLDLNLIPSHSLSQALLCCMEQCRQLEKLTVHLLKDEEDEKKHEAQVITKLPSVYPPLPSLRCLHLLSTAVTTEVHLLAILTACPNLHHLRLRYLDFLTLGVLPSVGMACRHLVSLRLSDLSPTIFLPTTLAVQHMARAPFSFSSSADSCLFPLLTDLHILQRHGYPNVPYGLYDPYVLSSLVSLLTRSPLTTLRLNVKFKPEHYSIFAPLRRLVDLDIPSLPFTHLCRATRSRRQAQHFMTRGLLTSEWSVDDVQHGPGALSGSAVFDPEPRWRVKEEGGERWLNGRDAFFALLSASSVGVMSDAENGQGEAGVEEEKEGEEQKDEQKEEEEGEDEVKER